MSNVSSKFINSKVLKVVVGTIQTVWRPAAQYSTPVLYYCLALLLARAVLIMIIQSWTMIMCVFVGMAWRILE